jgi:hypothetical protein
VKPISPWFPVAPHKFVVLSIFSLGIYGFYWFYQSWKRAKHASGADISPFWRTMLAPFYAVALLRAVRASAERAGTRASWSAEMLGAAYVILTLCALLPNVWTFVSVAAFVPLLPVVRTASAVNAAAGNPEGVNDRYTASSVVTIAIGSLVYAFVITVTFLLQ